MVMNLSLSIAMSSQRNGRFSFRIRPRYILLSAGWFRRGYLDESVCILEFSCICLYRDIVMLWAFLGPTFCALDYTSSWQTFDIVPEVYIRGRLDTLLIDYGIHS